MDPPQNTSLTTEQLNTFMQTIVQTLQNAQQVVPPAPEPPSFPKMNKEFTSLGVTKYYGDGSAEKAYEWIEEMECHFEKVKPSPTEKTQLGAQQLKTLALTWWNSLRAAKDVTAMEWDEFKKLFIREFVPRAKQSALMERFLGLRQEGRTVEKYYQTFKELSRYAPELVATEDRKVERFITGLLPDIKVQMAGSYDHDIWTVYNHAMRVETSVAEQKARRNAYAGENSSSAGPRKDQGNQGRYQHNRRGHGRQYRPYDRDQRAPAVQPGRAQGQVPQLPAPPARLALPAPLAAQQVVDDRTCYACHEKGHIASGCPQRQARRQPAPVRGRGGVRGRGRGPNQSGHQGARAYAALADQVHLEEPNLPAGDAVLQDQPEYQDQ